MAIIDAVNRWLSALNSHDIEAIADASRQVAPTSNRHSSHRSTTRQQASILRSFSWSTPTLTATTTLE